MKPYPEYKSSGIDWLGEIPSHWKVSKYKYHAESRMGITILREQMVEEGLPIYSATQDDSILGYTHDRSLVLHRDDFVIPARGNSIGNVSKVSFDEATCTQTTICSTSFHNISVDFLLYCCKGFKLKWFFFDDTAIPQITVSQVDNNVLPLPSINEQEAIAGYLDEVTGKIDALISEKTAQVEELRSYRSSLIAETVTHGLNPEVSFRDSGLDWVGQIPQDWEIKKLKYLVSCNDEVLSESTKRDAIINYVEISDVSLDEGVKQYSTIKFGEAPSRARRKTQLNDVIISTVRTYLKAIASININNLIVSTGFAVLRPKNINSRFLFYSLSSNKFLNQVESRSTGVSYPAITSTDLINIPVLIPPLSEQQEIADFLDEKTVKIDRLIEELTKQLDELDEYKQAVITEAVTGKVDVRDYQPNI